MNKQPLVSVLLPVGKDRRFLPEAVGSVKNQSYKSIELLVGEDKDGEGITKTLIKLAKKAKGEFLARMDADDISEPDRIEKQVKFLKLNPDVMLVGTWATLIDESGREIGQQKMPSTWKAVKKQVFYRNPFIHPSWMMRRKWFLVRGGYDESYAVAQDWEFISRWAWIDRMGNIPEALIKLRLHPKSVSFQKNRLQVGANFFIRWQMIKKGKVKFWRAWELLPSIISWFLPVGFKYNLRKNLLINDTRSGTRYQHQLKTLGIVLPMGQSKRLLQESGQWSLWHQELEFYRKKFEGVELFEYRHSDWRRYVEALLMPVVHSGRFRRCRVLKAVHLTGAIPCLTAKLLYGIPYVLSYGYRYDEFAVAEKKWGNWLLTKILTPIAIKFADVVMVPTEELKNYVKLFGAKKIAVIPNGVDVTVFKSGLKKGLSLRTQGESLSENRSGIKLLFVGRLEKQKNLEALIRAITFQGPTLEGRTLEYRMVFVGTGSRRGELTKLADVLGVNLEIKGPISNEKLPDVYRQADIFVLPSLIEGHPKALIEAMSCGLACLASNIPGVNEIITNGKNGLLVEPTAEGIRGGLQKLIYSPELRKRLGSAARKTVVEKFDKEKLMEREIKSLLAVRQGDSLKNT